MVRAWRSSRRTMMTVLARAMNASMTWARRSVQMASFLKPRLCQELVRSTFQRCPAWRGTPFLLITVRQPSSASTARAGVLSYPASRCTVICSGNPTPRPWSNRPSLARVGRREGESPRLAP